MSSNINNNINNISNISNIRIVSFEESFEKMKKEGKEKELNSIKKRCLAAASEVTKVVKQSILRVSNEKDIISPCHISIDASPSLKHIDEWNGIRRESDTEFMNPNTIQKYKKRVVNWIHGKRAHVLATHLFPPLIEQILQYCQNISKQLFPNDKSKYNSFYHILEAGSLNVILQANVKLHHRSSPTLLIPQNCVGKYGLDKILKKYVPQDMSPDNIAMEIATKDAHSIDNKKIKTTSDSDSIDESYRRYLDGAYQRIFEMLYKRRLKAFLPNETSEYNILNDSEPNNNRITNVITASTKQFEKMLFNATLEELEKSCTIINSFNTKLTNRIIQLKNSGKINNRKNNNNYNSSNCGNNSYSDYNSYSNYNYNNNNNDNVINIGDISNCSIPPRVCVNNGMKIEDNYNNSNTINRNDISYNKFNNNNNSINNNNNNNLINNNTSIETQQLSHIQQTSIIGNKRPMQFNHYNHNYNETRSSVSIQQPQQHSIINSIHGNNFMNNNSSYNSYYNNTILPPVSKRVRLNDPSFNQPSHNFNVSNLTFRHNSWNISPLEQEFASTPIANWDYCNV